MNKTIIEEASEIFVKSEELKKTIGEVKDAGKKCERCGQVIGYGVVTDHSSEGDGISAECEKGHSEECPVVNN